MIPQGSSMDSLAMHVRWIDHMDVDSLLECELAANIVVDKDFQTESHNPWTLKREGLSALVKQIRNVDEGTYDTRTAVLSVDVPCINDKNEEVIHPWLCGGFTFELLADCFEIVWFTLHPDASLDVAVQALKAFFKTKTKKSETRKKATILVRDWDLCANKDFGSTSLLQVSKFLPVLEKYGFSFGTQKLRRGYFGQQDAWELSLSFDNKNKPTVDEEDERVSC